ncbi:MAG: tetratricopeptide repeat protein, partial [Myxococcaceae bacterium]
MSSPLSLRCGRCDKRFRITPEVVMMHPNRARVDPRWNGIVTLPAVVCPDCGAEDEFSLTMGASLSLTWGLLRGLFGGTPGETGIARGEVKLWDGTVARSATHALTHLRSLTEQRPAEAEPWRRLGNFCLRCQRLDEAEKAFRRALDLDPDDDESGHSLINLLIEANRVEEALPLLRRTLAAVPVARWSPVEMRREITLDVLRYLSELMTGTGQGLALEVVWRCDRPGSQPTLIWSRAELVGPWERLVEVLVSERTVQA